MYRAILYILQSYDVVFNIYNNVQPQVECVWAELSVVYCSFIISVNTAIKIIHDLPKVFNTTCSNFVLVLFTCAVLARGRMHTIQIWLIQDDDTITFSIIIPSALAEAKCSDWRHSSPWTILNVCCFVYKQQIRLTQFHPDRQNQANWNPPMDKQNLSAEWYSRL